MYMYMYMYIYIISVFFYKHSNIDDSENSRGRKGTEFYSSLPLLLAEIHSTSDHLFLIASLATTRLLLDELCHVMELLFD